jgi:uncharacterized membrane protein
VDLILNNFLLPGYAGEEERIVCMELALLLISIRSSWLHYHLGANPGSMVEKALLGFLSPLEDWPPPAPPPRDTYITTTILIPKGALWL